MAYSAYECMTLEQILERMRKHEMSQQSCDMVSKAWAFAEKAHEGQKRQSGEPYFIHPAYVASIITEMMPDPATIAASLLHDTVEDCEGVTREMLAREFGEKVAQLVDGVTKMDKLDFADREERQAESLRKMFLAMSRDIRVVMIKLADRLHNMRTLSFQPRHRQVAIARETLDIYAPIAHRLGVYTIKQELEDLSLRYIDPEGYQDVARKVGMKRAEREENIKLVIDELSRKLEEAGMEFDVAGRPKHLYSIYRKMVIQNKPFDQIYDLIAIRVIVKTVPECYAVLGIAHTLWNQVPGRFKDYISVPKANMYQSLHTTVVGGRKVPFPFEIQIRTREMHRIAEYGIAAHWRYKDGGSRDELDKKLSWLRQIMDWSNETQNSADFLEGLIYELYPDDVFLFTPKGDIVSMQRDSTPLDFAYRIHSHVGNTCVGAKINGKIVPLDTTLNTGDQVEILTSSASKGPSMDWMKIVKTPQAKAKIRQFFKRELRGENVQKGRDMLEKEARRRGVRLGDYTKPEYYEPLLKKYMFQDLDDLYGAIGYGGAAAVYVLSRLMDEKTRQEAPVLPKAPVVDEVPQLNVATKPTQGVYVNGEAGMLVRFARCCNPVPGDDIVGYITRGRGVTIHKADCVNALNSEPERAVPVAWSHESTGNFDANIHLMCYEHSALLGELTAYMEEMKIPLTAIAVKMNKNKMLSVTMTLKVQSREQLDNAIRKLQKRSDVAEAYRSPN